MPEIPFCRTAPSIASGTQTVAIRVDDRTALPAPDTFHVEDGENAVSDARDRIVAVALTWGVPLSPAALSNVKLCASEIITNALTHAGGKCRITTGWTGHHLRVAVTDRSLQLPVVTAPHLDSESGRGLAIVEALAYSWGWEPDDLGKVVHFRIAADAAPSGGKRLWVLSSTPRGLPRPQAERQLTGMGRAKSCPSTSHSGQPWLVSPPHDHQVGVHPLRPQ
ncbi:ATP-binding protein [Streptomyces sp. NPDC059679]|uniref:ATP-binding protein n=1 Tax=Streptomyces sp. NPDC059679 TaxID=3346903 RepID=UPI00368A08D0